jgi:hypothetical protein
MVLILIIAVASMTGCKNGGEGGASNSGATGGSSSGSGGSKSSAGDFEGVIKSTMTFETKAVPVVYYVRPDTVRTETAMPEHPEAAFIQIMDLSNGKSTTLIPGQKKYMTTDFADVIKSAGGDKEPMFPKITATGQKETIAGYTCEHFIMGEKQNMDICAAKGLGFFGMGGSSGKGGLGAMFSSKMKEEAAANPEWSKFLEGGAFPLKMTVTEGGKTTMSGEVTSIERKKLDDSLFRVPADYTEMKIPTGMPGGVPGGVPNVPGKPTP